ncbi:hypothetical protein OXX69_001551 [Metschnikowia pulcherrima]
MKRGAGLGAGGEKKKAPEKKQSGLQSVSHCLTIGLTLLHRNFILIHILFIAFNCGLLMNSALEKKLRSFLNDRRDLQVQYTKLKESAEDLDLESREDLQALYDYDQLYYSHNAIKSYFEVSKSEWDLNDRQPFDSFADLMPKVEAKLHIDDLCFQHHGLQVLRRQLKENAQEGGKIAHSMMNTSATPEDLKNIIDGIFSEMPTISVPNLGNSLADRMPSATKKRKQTTEDSANVEDNTTSAEVSGKSPNHGDSRDANPQSNGSTVLNPSLRLSDDIGTPEADKSTAAAAAIRAGAFGRHEVGIGARTETQGTASVTPTSESLKSKVPPLAQRKGTTGNEASRSKKAESDSPSRDIESSKRVSTKEMQTQELPPSKKLKTTHGPGSESAAANAEKGTSQSPITDQTQSSQPLSNFAEQHKPNLQNGAKSVQTLEPSRPNRPLTAMLQRGVSSEHNDKYTTATNAEFVKGPVKFKKPSAVTAAEAKHDAKETGNASKGIGLAPTPEKPASEKSSFAQFSTWSKDYVRCIVNAAAAQPSAPAKAIQSALEEKFKVRIRTDEAEMLRSHYGLCESTQEKYAYYIQTFHSVATQFSQKRSQYVTVPWTEMRIQFARASRLQLEDWDLKGRFHLFLLHRRVYGSQGEPSSNFQDEVEAYKKKVAFRKSSSFLKSSSTEASQSSPPATSSVTLSPHIGSAQDVIKTREDEVWTPALFKALVDGYCLVAPETPNKALALAEFIRLKTNVKVDVHHILEKSKTKEFLGEVRKRRPNENEESIGKLSAYANNQSRPDVILSEMASDVRPDWYYKSKLRPEYLTKFWNYERTKCIMSTIEYADRISPNTTVEPLYVVRAKVLDYLRIRFLREHKIHIHEEAIKTRVVRMMELDIFDESQCRLLNDIIHKT